jgi:hypothetical protein
MIGVVFFFIAIISVLLALRYRSPEKDAAAILYQRFTEKTGLEPETGETAARFARRATLAGALPGTTIDSVTKAYHEARYGPVSTAAIVRLKTAVRAMG